VTWLWSGRIPFGKLTMLDGDPDLGKSTLLLDLAARVTRGMAMPGEVCTTEPRNVVILSAEDGPSDTICPRFGEAGGDAERVHLLTAIRRLDGTKDLFSLSDDVDALEAAITAVDAALVLIDPFTAYVGKANTWKDQDIRRVLARLADTARVSGAAIVLLRHLNKTKSDNALYRGGGSIAIIGAARSGLVAARDPDAPEERRLLATYKHNLCAQPSTLAYRLVPGKRNPAVGVVDWLGTDVRVAEQILCERKESPEDRSALAEAKELLLSELGNGPRTTEVIGRACRARGISERTLKRARAKLGVIARKGGFGGDGGWTLQLPDRDQRGPESPKGANHEVGPLSCELAPFEGLPVRNRSTSTSCGYHVGTTATACERCGRAYSDHVQAGDVELPWKAQGSL
jgi:hypothetical protein